MRIFNERGSAAIRARMSWAAGRTGRAHLGKPDLSASSLKFAPLTNVRNDRPPASNPGSLARSNAEVRSKCQRRDKHADLRHMCRHIGQSQQNEIVTMKGWLCRWYRKCN